MTGESTKKHYGFPLVGLLMLLVGLGFGALQIMFLVSAETTEGEVVEITTRRPAGNNAGLGYPVVAFTTPAGERVRFTGSEGSSPAAYDVGEKVDVYYRPNDPSDARLAGWSALFGGHLIAIGLGLVFLWVGIKELRKPAG